MISTRTSCITLLLLALQATAPAADLITADGTLYRDFKIHDVNENSLQIMHSDGSVEIAFTNLPPDMQTRWLPPETPGQPTPRDNESDDSDGQAQDTNNKATTATITAGGVSALLDRHYHRFYKFENGQQLFPEPLTINIMRDGRLYSGSAGLIRFQRETASYKFRSSNTNVFSMDTADRLILRDEGKAFLVALLNGAKSEFPVEVIEVPLRLGMTEEEVVSIMGKADAKVEVSVDWPDDKRIDYIRYKGYLPAEEWLGIPSRATHWYWKKHPGAVISMAEDKDGNKRLYQVSSGPAMTEKALDQVKKP